MNIVPEDQRKIGQFVVRRPLGRGGTAVVYEVEDPRGERFALKLLRADPARKAGFLARFEREIEEAALVDHPHLLKVYGTGEHEGEPYYIMELADGPTLRRALKKTPRPTLSEAARILKETTRGLGYLHARGQVHRDLKPANIFLTGPQQRVKIGDYGLLKCVELDDLTAANERVGTPAYMSPEQFKGLKIDRRTDIYQLGVLGYRLLSGRVPFVHENFFKLGMMHTTRAPPPLRELRPELAPDFEALILRCLEKRPRARFADAGELEKALTRVLVRLELGGGGGDLGSLSVSTGSIPPRPGVAGRPSRPGASGSPPPGSPAPAVPGPPGSRSTGGLGSVPPGRGPGPPPRAASMSRSGSASFSGSGSLGSLPPPAPEPGYVETGPARVQPRPAAPARPPSAITSSGVGAALDRVGLSESFSGILPDRGASAGQRARAKEHLTWAVAIGALAAGVTGAVWASPPGAGRVTLWAVPLALRSLAAVWREDWASGWVRLFLLLASLNMVPLVVALLAGDDLAARYAGEVATLAGRPSAWLVPMWAPLTGLGRALFPGAALALVAQAAASLQERDGPRALRELADAALAAAGAVMVLRAGL